MTNLSNLGAVAQGLVLGMVAIGCATAATITGHISGADLLTVIVLVTGAGGAVVGAHVGASQATAAVTASTSGPSPPAVTTGPPAQTAGQATV